MPNHPKGYTRSKIFLYSERQTPRSKPLYSPAASSVYKGQVSGLYRRYVKLENRIACGAPQPEQAARRGQPELHCRQVHA